MSELTTVLVKEACPLCGNLIDGPILMDTRVRKTKNQELENVHGKCIGFREKPCDQCKNYMEQGFLLIGVVEKKCGERNPEDIYRSGNIWVIRKDSSEKMFTEEFRKKGAAFIDVNVAKDMGFPDANINA